MSFSRLEPAMAARIGSLVAIPGWEGDSVRRSKVESRSPAPRRAMPRMTQPNTDCDSLLLRIARGDGDAVSECLDRYGPLVWSVAKRIWDDVATIEDIVQEVFIDVWKSAERFDPAKASEATFIATIARRRVIDRRRRVGRAPVHEQVDETSASAEDAGIEGVDLVDEARVARAALAALKPDQRRVILMSVVEGLTHPEIATATGLPLGTIKSHIRRGLDQAAQRLRAARGTDR